MKIENLSALAQRVVGSDDQSLQPVVEKEIVHYQILRALSEERLLGEMSFQGGTCLRLCYGSPRYSEDLDFAAGSKLLDLDLDGFSRRLSARLEDVFGDAVRVKVPKSVKPGDTVGLARWTVVVRTAPRRDDLPSQRVKIEVASVEPRTHVLRRLAHNYDALPASLSGWLIGCESKEEILADKLVSFANTEGRYRRRDLWDIPFLLATTPVAEEVGELVVRKLADYGCAFGVQGLLDRAAERILEVVEDGSLADELRRFLPKGLRDNELADGGERLAAETWQAYEQVSAVLGEEGDGGVSLERRLALESELAAQSPALAGLPELDAEDPCL